MPQATSRLKHLRLEARLSQNGIARKADLDRATVARAENGKEVSELTLAKLSSALSNLLNQEIQMNDFLKND